MPKESNHPCVDVDHAHATKNPIRLFQPNEMMTRATKKYLRECCILLVSYAAVLQQSIAQVSSFSINPALSHRNHHLVSSPSSFASVKTTLFGNVASEILKGGAADGGKGGKNHSPSSDTSNDTTKLSRPERKALERARKDQLVNGQTSSSNNRKKNANHRKHNFSQRQDILQPKRQPGEGPYDLHSTAVPRLTNASTPDDVMRAIKRAQNLHDAHDLKAIERFLLEETDASFAYGYRGSILARLAVAALHLSNHDLARKAIQARREEHAASMLPMESAAIIRGLLRVHNVTDALELLEEELALPDEKAILQSQEPSASIFETAAIRDVIKHHVLSLASIASRHFFEFEPTMAVLACQRLASVGAFVRQAGLSAQDLELPWDRILRGATKCQAARREGRVANTLSTSSLVLNDDSSSSISLPSNVVYAVLQAMSSFPSDNNDVVYELVSNALVRRVVFITGAISMEGCPPPDRGEAAFIGRSNVGKSSLVNMITNRKSLAYTSKRPGKTQQFNFFAVNDKVGREREVKYGDVVNGTRDEDSFYIVDLPGFGFARVPEQQSKKWLDFMREYIVTRKTLRVVFHLVDSRHGATEEDASIMRQVGQVLSTTSATYVIVLTKADKNVKGSSAEKLGKVSLNVMKSVRRTMKESGVGNAPVILSSSETKLGRDDLWRYLRLAAEA